MDFSGSTQQATLQGTLSEEAALRGILHSGEPPKVSNAGEPNGATVARPNGVTIVEPDSANTDDIYSQELEHEPSNEEILEYIEKHRLQEFLSDIIICVARHLPIDPFEFMLDNLEAMITKHREKHSIAPAAHDSNRKAPAVCLESQPPDVPREESARIVRCLATVLRTEETARAAAMKRLDEFGVREEDGHQLTQAGFAKLLDHVQLQWGLQPEDAKLMTARLQQWRFRANVAKGMRGLPLWPILAEDFVCAWPSLLRAVRDRYVPIGGKVHRSLFIRKAAGVLEDKYKVGQSLGRGAFGEVLLVTHTGTNQKRVCKRVGRAAQRVSHERLSAEVQLLAKMDHPHVVRLFEYFETEEHVDMVMEPVFGGTLTQLVAGFYCDQAGAHLDVRPDYLKESWVGAVVSQLLGALSYAHDVVGVIHKDLKTDNVLLVGAPYMTPEEVVRQPVHAMLADFGIAECFSAAPLQKMATESWETEAIYGGDIHNFGVRTGARKTTRSSAVGGTPSYMSPEMFSGSFTEKSDIWSLGIIMFQLLTGVLPYRGANLLMQAHLVGNPRRHPPWEIVGRYKWSLGARWCCQQLLAKDERTRPSASVALRDTWLVKATGEHASVPPGKDEIRALTQVHMCSHLSKMALNCVASQLNLSQLHHLNQRFKRYDTSGDGRLSHIEMRQALEDAGVPQGADTELIIESLDGDRSGVIEYSEFVAGCLNLAKDGIREQLRIAFDVFDLDGNGAISLDELRQVLSGKAGDAPPDDNQTAVAVLPDGKTAEDVLKDLDSNGSNLVDYAEFEAYLLEEHARAGKHTDIAE